MSSVTTGQIFGLRGGDPLMFLAPRWPIINRGLVGFLVGMKSSAGGRVGGRGRWRCALLMGAMVVVVGEVGFLAVLTSFVFFGWWGRMLKGPGERDLGGVGLDVSTPKGWSKILGSNFEYSWRAFVNRLNCTFRPPLRERPILKLRVTGKEL